MKKRTCQFASVATVALVAMSVSSTAAQAADDSAKGASPQEMAEIIVTANKRAENLSKVGLTITALGGAQLQQRNITSLQDLATAVPGLVFTQTDSNTPVYTLRGIGFYDTTLGAYPSVSVYLDETPLSFPVLTSQALFDVERVEVLKGPQGTLFGNNATGGAINYIAAKPTQDFSAGVSLDYARFNTFTADAYVSGPVTDTLLARVAVRATSGDGWQRSISRPDDRNGAPEAFAARFLLDWRPTDRLRIQTNLNGWRDRSEPPAAQFQKFIPNFPVPAGSGFVPPVPNAVDNARLAEWTPSHRPSADNRLLQAAVRADYEVTDAITLTSLTSYVDYRQRQVPEGDGLVGERIDLIQNDGYIHSFSTELRLADNSNPVFRWTLGANYSHDVSDEIDATAQHDATSNYTNIFAGLPFPGNTFTNHQVMKNYAVFGAVEYTFGQFTVKGSARYTQADRSTKNCNLGFTTGPEPNNILAYFNILTNAVTGITYPAGTCTIFASNFTLHEFQGELNQHNLSWRTGVDWKPSNNVLVYINVAKGYKAGSFPALSGSADLAFSPVTQESVLDVEGGVKLQLLDRKLSVNLAGFYNDYRDKQVKSKLLDPLFGKLDALVNIPKSEIKGFEAEVNARPIPGLTIGGAVTYLDTKLVEAAGLYSLTGALGDFSGNPIPRASKWDVSGNFNYSFSVGATTKAFFGGQIIHRSHATSSIGNEPDFKLPAYTTIDVQGGLEFHDGKVRIMVWGKNIMNEFYLTNIYQYTDGIQRFTAKPATYGVTLGYKF
ncbi:TonB-dependent receptor [Sphingobium sp. EM0848]|uniref:TonB-dependent receptor n=1 Tax=Sphingobium sp. EM0848 TaxID=2743473 RepID=UPI00159BF093|nr:TonB-dependent receptor [Sphingobium sp. EM0848]